MSFLLIYLVGTVIERLSQPAEILATLTCSFVSLKSLPFFNCFFFLNFSSKKRFIQTTKWKVIEL